MVSQIAFFFFSFLFFLSPFLSFFAIDPISCCVIKIRSRLVPPFALGYDILYVFIATL